MQNDSEFTSYYSENSFWDKVKKFAKAAGEKVLEPALKLYYAANDEHTPTWAKGIAYGALGYFISPVDAVPDLVPAVGYSDDMGVLIAAVAAIAAHINETHAQKARETLKQWFS